MAVQAVIFDLDGTLVQTRVASWEVFAPISERFGLGITEPEQYFDLFRGNLFASIRTLCRDDAHAAEVKDAFLTRLRSDYTPPMVPGMTDVVRRLAGDCTLAVMSSNAMQVLRRVLVNNDLAFCFAHVFGGDVAPDKRAAIRAFLADAGSGFGRRCSADYDEAGLRTEPDPSTTVLVTDTAGDVRDALEAGIRVVGVAWGMHSVEELTAAGAEFVALWPQEVAAHLLGDAAARPPTGTCAVAAPHRAGPERDPEPPPQPSGPTRPPGTARRNRRTAGAAALAGSVARPSTASDELLAAVTRVCRRE
jgi:phosphoglycolate phosphatase